MSHDEFAKAQKRGFAKVSVSKICELLGRVVVVGDIIFQYIGVNQ